MHDPLNIVRLKGAIKQERNELINSNEFSFRNGLEKCAALSLLDESSQALHHTLEAVLWEVGP